MGDASHLFEAALGSDIFTKIDAQERLRTNQINAREDRAFQYKSRIIDRAKHVTEKLLYHEQKMMRKTMYDIRARTLYFKTIDIKEEPKFLGISSRKTPAHRLKPLAKKKKKKKLEAHSNEDSQTLINSEESVNENDIFPENDKANRPVPPRVSKSLPFINMVTEQGKVYEIYRKPQRRKLLSESMLTLPSLTKTDSIPKTSSSSKLTDSESLSLNEDKLRSTTKKFIKKASYISQSLDSIYKKREEVQAEKDKKEKDQPKIFISPFGGRNLYLTTPKEEPEQEDEQKCDDGENEKSVVPDIRLNGEKIMDFEQLEYAELNQTSSEMDVDTLVQGVNMDVEDETSKDTPLINVQTNRTELSPNMADEQNYVSLENESD